MRPDARRTADRAPLRSSFVRFLASGLFNTIATYALYLALLARLGHAASYTVAFAIGLALSYLVNARFVFRSRWQIASAWRYAALYLGQYALGLAIVTLWVDGLGAPAALAPLAAIAVTVPLVFFASRALFRRHA